MVSLLSRAEASKSCSPEADYMVSRAAECMEHEDAGCAKLKLDPILEKEPTCPGASGGDGKFVGN